MLRRKRQAAAGVAPLAVEDGEESGVQTVQDVPAAGQQKSKAAKRREPVRDELTEAVLGRGGRALPSILGVVSDEEEGEDEAGDLSGSLRAPPPLEAVWEDEDDAKLRVNVANQPLLRKLRRNEDETVISGTAYAQRLKTQFERIYGLPQWAHSALASATIGGERSTQPVGLLQTSARLVSRRGLRLPPSTIDVSLARPANQAAPSEGVVQALEFHPSAPALLTASLDKTLRLFQVDGRKNTLLQSTFVRDLPMYSACFTPDGTEIFVSGRRPFFYIFDLETATTVKVPELQGKRHEKSLERMWMVPDGKHVVFTGHDGRLMFVSRQSRHWVCDLKMNCNARNVAFNSDGSTMYSSGDDGRIYVWDLSTRECTHTFVDEGCLRSTALAASPDGLHIATGSDSGVVNIYDRTCLRESEPKPLKAIMNLTTQVDTLHFNHDGQILGMASRMIKSAVRLVHMPSMGVFSNWPIRPHRVEYVHRLAFSPNGGYLALGNDKGMAPLFRLNHFDRL